MIILQPTVKLISTSLMMIRTYLFLHLTIYCRKDEVRIPNLRALLLRPSPFEQKLNSLICSTPLPSHHSLLQEHFSKFFHYSSAPSFLNFTERNSSELGFIYASLFLFIVNAGKADEVILALLYLPMFQ